MAESPQAAEPAARKNHSDELNQLNEFYDERSAMLRSKINILQGVNKRIASASEERELAKEAKHLKRKVIKEIRDKKKKKRTREIDIERKVLLMRLGQLNPRIAILCDDKKEVSQLMFGAGDYVDISSPNDLKKHPFDVVLFDTRCDSFSLPLIKAARVKSPNSHHLAIVDADPKLASAVAEMGCSLVVRPPLNRHALANLINRLVSQSPRRGLLSPLPPNVAVGGGVVVPAIGQGSPRSKPTTSPHPTPRGTGTPRPAGTADGAPHRPSLPNTPRSPRSPHPVVAYLQNLDAHRENEVSILKDELAMLHVEIEKSDDLMHELALQLSNRTKK
eukprot:TRINITY_DN19171_c0_g1_i1.p1 TRINITY_DN19171_c0_g1~~TRINITY_DN19171_c0_g1_i1.p1  ORF type:complete len:333 (+),score=66.95 TRINITY_DN19171_c0_g1_i1:50-1048(+)